MSLDTFYTDTNGKVWSHIHVISGNHPIGGLPLKDRLIPEDKKRFEEEYEKNKGARCSACGRR